MNKRSIIHKMDSGTIAVEMALLPPVLALLLLGMINGSAAWRAQQVLTSATREGARVASLTPNLHADDPTVMGVIDDILQSAGFQSGTYTSSVQFSSPLRTGDPVTVTITHNFTSVTGGVVPVVRYGIHLSASAVMRYSRFVQE
ncbi:MAG: pilus assembly protein [Candidatus Omnitrophica bacterium]|nr:pilus assembly protein [Candidatus Omnitrophota bacterium]